MIMTHCSFLFVIIIFIFNVWPNFTLNYCCVVLTAMDERLSSYALIARAASDVTIPLLMRLFSERFSRLNQVVLIFILKDIFIVSKYLVLTDYPDWNCRGSYFLELVMWSDRLWFALVVAYRLHCAIMIRFCNRKQYVEKKFGNWTKVHMLTSVVVCGVMWKILLSRVLCLIVFSFLISWKDIEFLM